MRKDASDTTIKEITKKNHATALSKAQATFDEKKNVLDTVKNTINTWTIKLADAQKTFEQAKAEDEKNS